MNFIMTLDVDTVIALIHKAHEKREEERAFVLYASAYPHFSKQNFKKFHEFYRPTSRNISTRSSDEILSAAEAILKKRGDKGGAI
jgi:hypothetical protein